MDGSSPVQNESNTLSSALAQTRGLTSLRRETMINTIKTTALSALISLSALAAVPASAQADSFYFGIGGGHRPGVEFFIGEDRYQRAHWERPRYRHWERPRHRACTPYRAVRKAARMGLRHVYVRNVNRNRIRVEGRDHGDRVRVTFARAPGCPVIRVRG